MDSAPARPRSLTNWTCSVVFARDPPRPADRAERRRPLAPGPARQPSADRSAATRPTRATPPTPEIEGFLKLGVTNARTEGYNRVIKQVKRVACGFRNQANYQRRIMLHIAATRAA